MYILDYHLFNLELKESLPVVNSNIYSRKGIYLTLKKNGSIQAIAEASPLPGLSKEALETVLKIIQKIILATPQFTLHSLDQKILELNKYPSLQFALNTLYLQLNSTIKSSKVKTHTFIKKICTNTPFENKYIKYKIGLNNINNDIANINKIIKVHPDIKFRLDANFRLSLKQLCFFFSKIKKENIDYIEDPCKIENLNEFYNLTNINYALDTPSINIEKPDNLNGLSALIVKPSLIGTVNNINNLKKKFNVKRIVLSSSYETKIGIQGLLNYAQIISPQEIHGLNTEHFFKYFINKTPISEIKSTSIQDMYKWMLNNGS